MQETKFRVVVEVEADVARDDPARFEKGIETIYFTINKDFLESPFRLSDWTSETGWRIVKVISIDQYTGRKDKDGEEIYDRDILEIRPNSDDIIIVQVVFHQGCFCYTHKKGAYFTFYSNVPGHNFTMDRKIIGNVHENPELLEKKDDK